MMDVDNWERERLMEALDSYQRGLSDAPYLSKRVAASGPAGGQEATDFVVSTDEVDRHGDTIAIDGWQTEAYMRNPVFLWAHAYYRPAIGRALEVWKEPHSLHARIEFAPTDFAREIATLYQGGYQRGVSVGFRPLKYAIRRDSQTGGFLGINFIEQELLEISAAPVPANQSALRKVLNDTPRMRDYFAHSDAWENDPVQEILAALRNARVFLPA